jgi:hypothetical protein
MLVIAPLKSRQRACASGRVGHGHVCRKLAAAGRTGLTFLYRERQ